MISSWHLQRTKTGIVNMKAVFVVMNTTLTVVKYSSHLLVTHYFTSLSAVHIYYSFMSAVIEIRYSFFDFRTRGRPWLNRRKLLSQILQIVAKLNLRSFLSLWVRKLSAFFSNFIYWNPRQTNTVLIDLLLM